MKRRLLQEATSPWRTVRTFFFGAFGFSATVGGLTAVTQLAASVAGRENALPLQTSLTNVGVDLAVVLACVVGWRLEARAEADVTLEASPLTTDELEARTKRLLRLGVSVGLGNDRREATLETLRGVAKQSVVVLGGPAASVDDAMTDALIQQKLFVSTETLVVPVRLDATTGEVRDDYASKPMYAKAGFVALPVGDDWADFVRAEVATATDQGAASASSDGVVIAVRQDGSIARRGVGKPPWKQLLRDIKAPSSSSSSARDDDGDDDGGASSSSSSSSSSAPATTTTSRGFAAAAQSSS